MFSKAPLIAVATLVLFFTAPTRSSEPSIAIRGYYMTFMRMPTFGLTAWKQMIDCMADDHANTLLLWTAGGFRSKKFPITWQYNRTHKNVEQDFVRDLIDYAHKKHIKVLLCFTPFAYDGVNQYPLEHPELKARQRNGQPANFWGMHSWGYNLCASQPESQRFVFDYAREMFFDFYPNADGLMMESSDYAICYCSKCNGKYFDREFELVRQLSDEVWRRKPTATIVVYPHYFTTRKVPGFDVPGAEKPFEPRWTLFFTPHSAHIETNLVARATNSIYSDALTLGDVRRAREGALLVHKYGLTGYVPSLEPMTCPPGPPKNPGPYLKPFHFDWLKDGEMPLNELPIALNRLAYREYTRNPELTEAAFQEIVGKEVLGDRSSPERFGDMLFVQQCWFLDSDWFSPGSLVNPERLKERAIKEHWAPERIAEYGRRIEQLRAIAARSKSGRSSGEQEMHRIARMLVDRWDRVMKGPAK